MYTDHKPLLGLLKEDRAISHMSSAHIQRWALTLTNYQYHLQYNPGCKNANADALSRLPLAEQPTRIPVPEEVVLALDNLDRTPVTSTHVARWTSGDTILSAVMKFTMQGWPMVVADELSVYHRKKDELSVQQGCLLWGSRVIVPVAGRESLMEELHETHPGMVRMKSGSQLLLVVEPGRRD